MFEIKEYSCKQLLEVFLIFQNICTEFDFCMDIQNSIFKLVTDMCVETLMVGQLMP